MLRVMDTDTGLIENVKACRTCGIHYVTPSKDQLKHLFKSSLEHSEIMLIRLELSQWNVEVSENDGFPQYVCKACIHKFEKVFALRAACINVQSEFRKFYAVPNGNVPNVKVKTEPAVSPEQQIVCDFIYVDDLSDTECDGATKFNISHIPIKEEIIEEAIVPVEENRELTNIVQSASNKVETEKSSHLTEILSGNEILAHEASNFECEICGKQFKNSTASRFKFHMKWHTLNRNLKCSLCGFVSNSKDILRKHKRLNHGKLNCKICGKGVLAKKMKYHLRQHKQLPEYPCEYCGKVFNTEDGRENHIWQIHANEDNDVELGLTQTFQKNCTQAINANYLEIPQGDNLPQEPLEIALYKFMCAYCDHRFMEQKDLETHVNEEHRLKSHLPSIRTDIFFENNRFNETVMNPKEHDKNEIANIEIFEEYGETDNNSVANNDTSLKNEAVFTLDFMLPSTSSEFVTHFENGQHSKTEDNSNDTSDEEFENADNNNDINSNLTPYAVSDLNTFSCAKCPHTFASIEQLREHYESHLASYHEHKGKPRFKCYLCSKTFDLKFILNRHVRKHKHPPIYKT